MSRGDSTGADAATVSNMSPTPEQAEWLQELRLYALAGAQELMQWQREAGYNQEEAAALIQSFMPPSFKRGMTNATLSRYQKSESFWHVSFAVWLTAMIKVYHRDFADVAKTIRERVLDFKYGQSGGADLERELRSRRQAQEGVLLTAFRGLTAAQQHDKILELTMLAKQNAHYRATSHLHGGAYDTDDAETGIGGGLLSTLETTQQWADEQRRKDQSERSQESKGG